MIKAFSFGGGVQSTAALVLAASGKIDYQTFLFSNVGADSENPDTLAYVEEVSKPFAAHHRLNLIELSRPDETLLSRITGEGNRGYVIPAYTPDKKRPRNGSPGRRICTADFKVEVIASWLKEQGATEKAPALVGMGISVDEAAARMNLSRIAWEVLDYPLVNLAIDRQQCINIIAAAGLPVPPRSACIFCPHHTLRYWQELREQHPDRFQQVVKLERFIGEREQQHGRPKVYLTRLVKPMEKLTTEDYTQPSLFGEMCESGHCFV
jgi:hypothetical protein